MIYVAFLDQSVGPSFIPEYIISNFFEFLLQFCNTDSTDNVRSKINIQFILNFPGKTISIKNVLHCN